MINITDSLIQQKETLSNKDALIIFIKNPQLGKVKTRLAATLGNERALEIYHILMQHTMLTTKALDAQKYVFYSDFIDANDIWDNEVFQKNIQFQTQDLGLKMASAFKHTVLQNHKKVLIIGSDCLELTPQVIEKAYMQLSHNEVVIGPAYDGGYYLIGFNFERIGNQCDAVFEQLFLNKEWSHDRVCEEAINTCIGMNFNYYLLPTLTDVDEEKDYLKTQHLALKIA